MADLLRMMWSLMLVVALTGGVLRGLDALPGWWLEVGRSGVRFDGVEALEGTIGRRLLQPAYFPDTLAWPPERVVLDRRPPRSALLGFVRRADGTEALRLWQAVEGDGGPPALATLQGVGLHDVAVPLRNGEARLRTVRLPDGRVWDEMTFRRSGRWVVLHSMLPAEQTVRLADSLR